MPKGKTPKIREQLLRVEEHSSRQETHRVNELLKKLHQYKQNGDVERSLKMMQEVITTLEQDHSIVIPKADKGKAADLLISLSMEGLAHYYDSYNARKGKAETAELHAYKEGFASVITLLVSSASEQMLAAAPLEKTAVFWEAVAAHIQNYASIDVTAAKKFKDRLPPVKIYWDKTSARQQIIFYASELASLDIPLLPKAAAHIANLALRAFDRKEINEAWLQALYQQLLFAILATSSNRFPEGSEKLKFPGSYQPLDYQDIKCLLIAGEEVNAIKTRCQSLTPLSNQAKTHYAVWEEAFTSYLARYELYLEKVVKELVDQENAREALVQKRYAALAPLTATVYETVSTEEETTETPTPSNPLSPYRKQLANAVHFITTRAYRAAMVDFLQLRNALVQLETQSEDFSEEERQELRCLKSETSLGCVEAFLCELRPFREGLFNLRAALQESLESMEGLKRLEKQVQKGFSLLLSFNGLLEGLSQSMFYMKEAAELVPEDAKGWFEATARSLGTNVELIEQIRKDFLTWEERHKEWKIKQGKYGPSSGQNILSPSVETRLRWNMLSLEEEGVIDELAATIRQITPPPGSSEYPPLSTIAHSRLPLTTEITVNEDRQKAFLASLEKAKKTQEKEAASQLLKRLLGELSLYEPGAKESAVMLQNIRKEASYHLVLHLSEAASYKSSISKCQKAYEQFPKMLILRDYITPIAELLDAYVKPVAAYMKDAQHYAEERAPQEKIQCQNKLAGAVLHIKTMSNLVAAFKERAHQKNTAANIEREKLDTLASELVINVEKITGKTVLNRDAKTSSISALM